LTIYIQEAHPKDEWQMPSNETDDICYVQPRSLEDRALIAADFVTRFHYPIPMAIDSMGNDADHRYAAWPERLYIIDETGHIAYRGGMGPFDYHPEEVSAWLDARTHKTTGGP